MKKIVLSIIAITFMISCGGKKNTEVVNDLPIQTSKVLEQPVDDGHNAKNSLDYEGSYQGAFLTKKGDALQVILVLKDTTYTKSVSYVGKTAVLSTDTNSYSWNQEGTTITLHSSEEPNQFFVGENTLFPLDKDGQKMQGDSIHHYNLVKLY